MLGLSLGQWDALDESERSLWLARQHRTRQRHSCGHPHDVCSDAGKPWFPQLSVCYPTMQEQAANARWQRLHEARPWHDGSFTSWREKPDDEHPYHFSHGATVWVAETDHGHGGDFLTEESPTLTHDGSEAP